MILINLLPHREAARKRRREMFYASLGASAFAGGVIAAVVYAWYATAISGQESRNLILTNEIHRLDRQIKDIATLQDEITGLRARQQAVEDLQADRNLPVHLLNELVAQVPDGVYLTSMKQNNDRVAITGVAQSNERVSELLRNLGSNSPWLARPELVEIVAGNVNLSPKDVRRVANFKMNVQLRRASEAQKAASAAAAASAATAARAAVAKTGTPAAMPASSAVAAVTPASGRK